MVDFTAHTVTISDTGFADYVDLWSKELMCDNGYASLPITESLPVTTSLQTKVVAAARRAGYEGTDEEALYSIYNYCGSNNPSDPYMTMELYSNSQVLELGTWLTLCPTHPQAAKWKAVIVASTKPLDEEDGDQITNGTYRVPSEMARGSYVTTDVEDCYWETRDKNGDIVANNFVIAAPRVVAKVSSRAVVFTSRGCEAWSRQ